MKPVTGKRLCKAVEAKGWVLDRVRGSHHIYAHPERPGIIVTVAVHAGKTLKRRTQHSIMKTAGLTDEDL